MAKKNNPKFVTVEKFNELAGSVNSLVDLITKQNEKLAQVPQTPEVIAKEKAITNAGPKPYIQPVNPEWEAMAHDIIGAEKIERCELEHVRSGGTLFTVVIKREYSNASDDYLRMFKEDRRSKEIGQEGIGGVENWCKLIDQNLKRGKTYVAPK